MSHALAWTKSTRLRACPTIRRAESAPLPARRERRLQPPPVRHLLLRLRHPRQLRIARWFVDNRHSHIVSFFMNVVSMRIRVALADRTEQVLAREPRATASPLVPSTQASMHLNQSSPRMAPLGKSRRGFSIESRKFFSWKSRFDANQATPLEWDAACVMPMLNTFVY